VKKTKPNVQVKVEVEKVSYDDSIGKLNENQQQVGDAGNNQMKLQPQVKTEINTDANVNIKTSKKVNALGIIE